MYQTSYESCAHGLQKQNEVCWLAYVLAAVRTKRFQLDRGPRAPLPPRTQRFSVLLRRCPRMQVSRQNLQLVGVTAMLLASKYEEIYPPCIRDLVFITDRAYNREQILEMESTMANALQFRLTVPTIYCFLLRYLKVIADLALLYV